MVPRIVTLTLNPAIDMASTAPVVRPMHKIRTFDEHVDPGGGGVNVARVIHELGGETLALVLTGDVTGHFLNELLDGAGVPHRSLPIAGRTRVSTTVHDQATGQEYRFVPEGPVVTAPEWQAMLAALEQIEAGWVVASGSLPRGAPDDFYAQAARIAARRGQSFVLDSSGSPLKAALGQGITLLKLSLNELHHLLGRPLADPRAQADEAMALVGRGAAAHGGADPGCGGRAAGQRRRRAPDGSAAGDRAQRGRCRRRVPGGDDPGAGTRQSPRARACLGYRRRRRGRGRRRHRPADPRAGRGVGPWGGG